MVTSAENASRRKLFVFGDETSAQVMQQRKLLDDATPGLRERDIVVTFAGSDSALIKKYNRRNEPFLVVLVGKDGGEKHRTDTLLVPEELFAIVDAMPMRRAEIRRKSGGN